MMRNWTINGRFLAQPVTGVQRYATEIVRALDGLVTRGHPMTNGLTIKLAVPAGTNTDLGLNAIRLHPCGPLSGQAWEQAVLPRHVDGGLISLCNTGPLACANHILCIHDMNTRLAPESYTAAFRLYYRTITPALGRRAAAIVTVSNFSAQQLSGFGIAPLESIRVIPNGHEHVLRWRSKHTPQTRAVAGPGTIVLLGSTAPHKNICRVLNLAPRLAEHGLRIAVAGISDPRIFSDTSVPVEAANITWLGRLTDAALSALLKDCLCLAFPSLTEGFGLPPLEAMAAGCPVVASNRASLPEVCGNAVLYASPASAEEWFEALLRLSKDPALRQQLQTAGMARATQFSWQRSAELYLTAMAEIDNLRAVEPMIAAE